MMNKNKSEVKSSDNKINKTNVELNMSYKSVKRRRYKLNKKLNKSSCDLGQVSDDKRSEIKTKPNKRDLKNDDKNMNSNKSKNRGKKLDLNRKRKSEIWFEGVDKCLVKASMMDNKPSDIKNERLVKEQSFAGITKIVAMDCEMVGTGSDGVNSALARVSIVNLFGHCIYDKYVKPVEEITDYRTHVSGIRPSHMTDALDLNTAQKEVHHILKDRIIVGHALRNDFKALFLSYPKHKIRDTSKYFKHLFGGRNPALRKLSETVLGVKIQTGEHDSVEDARVAMRLFTMFRRKWESDIRKKTFKFNKK